MKFYLNYLLYSSLCSVVVSSRNQDSNRACIFLLRLIACELKAGPIKSEP